jgi:methyl-accepting chemotaxis protein
MFVFTLFLVLMGMIILRQIFDEVIGIAKVLKRTEQGEKVVIDLNKTTSELHEISCSFNSLLEKREISNGLLEKQTERLNREINGRRLVEEELSKKTSQLDQLAHHDILTGLMNREMFNDHLKR